MELDVQGRNLLSLLVTRLDKAVPGRPETYIGYKECHVLLGLEQQREKWGESLKSQGLLSLAGWTETNGFPGITGLIVSLSTLEPGKGYFHLFDKDEVNYDWWAEQIRSAKSFDWSPYLAEKFDLVPSDLEVPNREDISISRIIRDTALSYRVKLIHGYKCQLCGIALSMPNGKKYAEVHHIKPLGQPHDGPDVIENMICVCPNHHAQLDYGAIKLLANNVRTKQEHQMSDRFIDYHNESIYRP
ncbi:HNH endonuclease [Vreelandella titanicae]|uniref:HNH nuclease domain-containing protein n=1 Tax=Vreelandella titanicae TaxID=664683 RepID=A0A558J2D1_9GAMM|nr:HNH endonuclease [Halomonas titanicae]TVU87767.1 hypothetical protein FQP89_19500 [Halomonas titanicae]